MGESSFEEAFWDGSGRVNFLAVERPAKSTEKRAQALLNGGVQQAMRLILKGLLFSGSLYFLSIFSRLCLYLRENREKIEKK